MTGYLTNSGVAFPVDVSGVRSATVLAGFGPDETYWLDQTIDEQITWSDRPLLYTDTNPLPVVITVVFAGLAILLAMASVAVIREAKRRGVRAWRQRGVRARNARSMKENAVDRLTREITFRL